MSGASKAGTASNGLFHSLSVQSPSTPLKLWFTAQEIADFAAAGVMAGMPETKRGVNEVIEREKWNRVTARCRPRPGHEGGGGFEYHLELLPAHVRLSYLVAMVAPCGEMARRVALTSPPVEVQTDRVRLVAMAKVWLIEEAVRCVGYC